MKKKSIQNWFKRTFVFNKQAQVDFLNVVLVQLEANRSIGEIFIEINKHATDQPTKDVSRLAYESIENRGEPFATRFYQSGFFTKKDATHLVAAEKNKTLMEGIRFLIQEKEGSLSVISGVFTTPRNAYMTFLFGVVHFQMFVMYGNSAALYERYAARLGKPELFYYIEWLKDYGIPFILISAFIIVFYNLIRIRSKYDPLRRKLKEDLGFFNLSDIITAYEYIHTSKSLYEQDIAPSKTNKILTSLDGDKYFESVTQRIQRDIDSGKNASEAIGSAILEPRYKSLFTLFSTKQSTENFAIACKHLGKMLRIEIQRRFDKLERRYYIAMLALNATGIMLIVFFILSQSST